MDPKYLWGLGEIATYPSDFTSKDVVEDFVSSFNICSNNMSEFIMAEVYDPNDGFYMKLRTKEKILPFYTSSSLRSSTYSFPFLLLSVD